jgi:hypothetical protein
MAQRTLNEYFPSRTTYPLERGELPGEYDGQQGVAKRKKGKKTPSGKVASLDA